MPFRRAPAGRGVFHRFLAAAALVSLALGASAAHATPEGARHDNDKPRRVLAAWHGATPQPFQLNGIDNASLSLADVRTDIVIVHFFATWCEPCRDELPSLRRLVERSDPAQLRVISISVAEPAVRVRRFIEKLPVNFPILLDDDRAVSKSWNVSALPTTFILDRNHNRRLFVERDYNWDQVDARQLLGSIDR